MQRRLCGRVKAPLRRRTGVLTQSVRGSHSASLKSESDSRPPQGESERSRWAVTVRHGGFHGGQVSVAILLDKFIAASSAAVQEENDKRLQEKKDQEVKGAYIYRERGREREGRRGRGRERETERQREGGREGGREGEGEGEREREREREDAIADGIIHMMTTFRQAGDWMDGRTDVRIKTEGWDGEVGLVGGWGGDGWGGGGVKTNGFGCESSRAYFVTAAVAHGDRRCASRRPSQIEAERSQC
jgi:hypothetical protein